MRAYPQIGDNMTTVKRKLELPKPTYVKYSELKSGMIAVQGTFVGTTEVDKYNGKPGEKVPCHVFETDKGEVRLNSAKSLDRILETADPGMPLRVTFLGKEKKKSKEGMAYSQNNFQVDELDLE